MRRVKYEDTRGFLFIVEIPDDAPDSEAKYGNPVGPPVLSGLGLPLEVERALNRELFARGLFTFADVRKRQMDVLSALKSALSLDVGKVMEAYKNG